MKEFKGRLQVDVREVYEARLVRSPLLQGQAADTHTTESSALPVPESWRGEAGPERPRTHGPAVGIGAFTHGRDRQGR